MDKYTIKYQNGIVVNKLVKVKKCSHRERGKRKFNATVLQALQNADEIRKEIEFWKRYAGTKHYDNLVSMMTTALQMAETMKQEFLKLGKSFRMGNYTPHTNEIKRELFKLNQLTLL